MTSTPRHIRKNSGPLGNQIENKKSVNKGTSYYGIIILDNKIKKIVEGELKGYENFVKESEKLLKKYKVEPKEKSIMANIFSFASMKLDLLNDNSDAKIADMLTKGFTMGVVDITKRIDNFKDDADSKIINLAKDLKKFSEENIELLKPYL